MDQWPLPPPETDVAAWLATQIQRLHADIQVTEDQLQSGPTRMDHLWTEVKGLRQRATHLAQVLADHYHRSPGYVPDGATETLP